MPFTCYLLLTQTYHKAMFCPYKRHLPCACGTKQATHRIHCLAMVSSLVKSDSRFLQVQLVRDFMIPFTRVGINGALQNSKEGTTTISVIADP
jgi:hypothetical protein